MFLSYLALKLSDLGSNIIFGTDNERSLVNVIEKRFDKPIMLRCTKHLKDNVQDQLKDKIGLSVMDRSKIGQQIFGHMSGIAVSNSEAVFHDLFIYLGFYVAFNTVQIISRRVVGRAEETSTYSSLGFCTVNCRPTASNYQLSHLRPCRESNPGLRGGRQECYHSATVAPLCFMKNATCFTGNGHMWIVWLNIYKKER